MPVPRWPTPGLEALRSAWSGAFTCNPGEHFAWHITRGSAAQPEFWRRTPRGAEDQSQREVNRRRSRQVSPEGERFDSPGRSAAEPWVVGFETMKPHRGEIPKATVE